MDKVNCTIPLAETQIEVLRDSGRSWSKVPAKVTMRLSPVPRIFIEITNPGGVPVVLMNSLDYGARPKLRLSSGPKIEAFVTECNWGRDYWGRLIPTQQPVTVIQTGVNLRSVKFNLINFPSLDQRNHPTYLDVEPWCIEINAVPELSEIKKILKIESGYAVTHEGTVRRSDDQSFSVEDAQKLLDVLRLFLSFARGGDCGVTLISGIDESGQQAWEQWGTYPVHPWLRLSSWLDHRLNNDDELSRAFPGFWHVMGKTTDAPDDPARLALYWYLRSNESKPLEAGIILTQAALERLASQMLSNEKYETLKYATERIQAVLKEAGIDPVIPQSCKELRKVAQVDGPGILTKIRNDLVHAEMRTNVSMEAYLEARDLGQWYVELLLLRLFGYDGQYANRIAYNEGRWEPEVVPWAQSVEEPGSNTSGRL